MPSPVGVNCYCALTTKTAGCYALSRLTFGPELDNEAHLHQRHNICIFLFVLLCVSFNLWQLPAPNTINDTDALTLYFISLLKRNRVFGCGFTFVAAEICFLGAEQFCGWCLSRISASCSKCSLRMFHLSPNIHLFTGTSASPVGFKSRNKWNVSEAAACSLARLQAVNPQ